MMRLLRLALVVVVLACPGAARAAPADVFSVFGVEVDVTAANASAARDQALTEAQRIAFRRLLERLAAPADWPRLPSADALQYVRDFAIEQERASTVRYIATITVRFNGAAVRKLLRDAGIKYAETRPRPVVVVPVFKSRDGRPLLWDDANPWRAAWVALGPGGLVPLVVPPGDAADQAGLDAAQALANDPERLDALGRRFRTPDVLVAAAGVSPNGSQVDVSLSGTPGVPKPFDSRSFPIPEGTPVDLVLKQAANDISAGMETAYKQGNVLQFDRAATMSVLAPLGSLEDWLSVRERLSRVAQVRAYEVVSLSKAEAALTLHTVGDQEQVKAALAGAGLSLEWTNGYWTMRPSGRR
ncbi:MAG: DUF2066 domain-containing protein [Actinomycetota bacterium]